MGEKCQNEACRRRDYAFIPDEFHNDEPQDDLYLGRRIDDFVLTGILGKGGFGKVYLALMMPVGLQVALKVLNREPDEEMDRRFFREARSLAMLKHPNIVGLNKFGNYRGNPFIAMEYVGNSRTLSKEIRDRVRRGQGFDHQEVPHIIHQLLNALDEAHSRAVIHRDIKPENILLQRVKGDDLFVKVLDFGLAKFTSQGSKMSMVMGTPKYMAIEQFSNAMSVGPWTDLYSVAVLIFELITGYTLFRGTAQEVFSQKINEGFDPFAEVAREMAIPERVLMFFQKGIAKDPEQRFRSVQEFRLAFDELVSFLSENRQANMSSGKLERLLDSSDWSRIHHGSTKGHQALKRQAQHKVTPKIRAGKRPKQDVENEDELATQALPAEDSDFGAFKAKEGDFEALQDQSKGFDAMLNPPWYKGAGSLVLAGIVVAGLAIGGYFVFNFGVKSENSPKKWQVMVAKPAQQPTKPVHISKPTPVVAKPKPVVHKALTPVKTVRKPIPALREVEIRPVYMAAGKSKLIPNVKIFVDGKLTGITTRAAGVQIKIRPGTHKLTFEGPTIEKKTVNKALSAIKSDRLDITMELSW